MAYNFGSSSSSAATVVVKTGISSATDGYVIAQITPTPSKIETWEISINIQDIGNDRNKSWQILQVTTHWIDGYVKVLGSAINLANGTSGPAIWTFSCTSNSSSNLLEVKVKTPTLSGLATSRVAYLLLNTQDGTLTHPVITPETYFTTKLLSWIDVDKVSSLTLSGSTCTSIADARGGVYPAWVPTTQNGYGFDPGFQYYSSGFNGTSMPFVGNSNADLIDPAPAPYVDKAWLLTSSGITYGATDKYLLGVVVNLGVYWTGGYKLFQDPHGSVLQFETPGRNEGFFNWTGIAYESGPALFTFQLYPGYNIAKMYIPNVSDAHHSQTISNPGSRNLSLEQTIGDISTLHRMERLQLCEFALVADHTDPVADELALASMLRLKWGI